MATRVYEQLAQAAEAIAVRLREVKPSHNENRQWRLSHELRMVDTGLDDIVRQRDYQAKRLKL